MKRFDQLRNGLTLMATVGIWSLLLWQHFYDGVPAHHLLDNPELPVVSNWWGGLLLPVLTWGLLSLTRRRMIKADAPSLQPVIVGLVGGIALGIAMTVTFYSEYQALTSYVFFGVLLLALLLPIYRPECLLGFVLGMSVGFGVVLPTLFGTVLVVEAFIIHKLIGRHLLKMVRRRMKLDQAAG